MAKSFRKFANQWTRNGKVRPSYRQQTNKQTQISIYANRFVNETVESEFFSNLEFHSNDDDKVGIFAEC